MSILLNRLFGHFINAVIKQIKIELCSRKFFEDFKNIRLELSSHVKRRGDALQGFTKALPILSFFGKFWEKFATSNAIK